jgi:hypothetical protein
MQRGGHWLIAVDVTDINMPRIVVAAHGFCADAVSCDPLSCWVVPSPCLNPAWTSGATNAKKERRKRKRRRASRSCTENAPPPVECSQGPWFLLPIRFKCAWKSLLYELSRVKEINRLFPLFALCHHVSKYMKDIFLHKRHDMPKFTKLIACLCLKQLRFS